MNTANLVTGMVKTTTDAESVITSIMGLGYTRDDISVIMSEAAQQRHLALETGTQAAAGAGVGGMVGGAMGALVAAIAALGTTVILPGLIVAGPLVAALVGAGAGGATGTVIGAMVGAGIPEERARFYETGLASGAIVIGVVARSDADVVRVEHILQNIGATRIRIDAPPAERNSLR